MSINFIPILLKHNFNFQCMKCRKYSLDTQHILVDKLCVYLFIIIYIIVYVGSQAIVKYLNRIQLGKCSQARCVNNLCFDRRYTIDMMYYLSRLNRCLKYKVDSLFSWEIDQSSSEQGICMNCLEVFNYLNFELLNIKDKQLSLYNIHIQAGMLKNLMQH